MLIYWPYISQEEDVYMPTYQTCKMDILQIHILENEENTQVFYQTIFMHVTKNFVS